MEGKRQWMGEALRFGVVGTVATGLHYGSYYLLRHVMEVNVAYTVGYVLSFIANFYMTAYFTFGTPPSWSRLAGMGGAHVSNYLLHMVLLNVFLWVGVPGAWAPLPVFAVAIPVNFLLVRWVFHRGKRAPAAHEGSAGRPE